MKSCVHQNLAGILIESDVDIHSKRSERICDEDEINKVERRLNYILENKRIPFEVSEYLDTKIVAHFSPIETVCVHAECESQPLKILKTSKRGIVYGMQGNTTGLSVTTKICVKCRGRGGQMIL